MINLKTLKRSKLGYKLRKVQQYPVTIASAPSGFGKTTALHHYFHRQDIESIWFSMYGQQDEQSVWDIFIDYLNQHYTGMNLPKTFPSTRKSIDTFIETLGSYIKKPLFIVLDDVIIKDIPNIIHAIYTYSHIAIPSFHVIVVTKDKVDSAVSYRFSKNILQLNTNDFAFTKEELHHLCRLESIKLSSEEIDTLYTYTNGWILALSFMLESYKTHRIPPTQGELDALMQYIIFEDIDFEVQEDLIKLSILKSFTFGFIAPLCKTKKTLEQLIVFERENQFIQMTADHTYQFIPIFKDFLAKRLLVSSNDINAYIREIAQHYLEQEKPLESIELLLSIRDFDTIIEIFNQYFDISFTNIAPNLILAVFQKLPDSYKNEYPYIYLKWIADCITNFPQRNGVKLLEDFKKRIDTTLIQEDKEQLYGEYYFVHALTHFNDIKKMMGDFKTSYQYFKGGHSYFAYSSMITSFGSCHLLFLYYSKMGSLIETVEYIEQNLHYFISISNGLHAGAINLIKAEYFYETGQYTQVPLFVDLAYKESMESDQLSGAICCLFLMGRLALIEHNISQFKQIERRLIDFYQKTNIPILHHQIDCALGYLYILDFQFDKVKDWLKNGDFETVYLPPKASMIAYIIYAMCLVKEHNLIKLKHICGIIKATNKTMSFALADIYIRIFEIVYQYEIGKTQVALGVLSDVITLCKKDCIISPIVELSFAFDQLFEHYVPNNSFEDKIVTAIYTHLEKYNEKYTSSNFLTPKEKEVLKLYVEGKKVKEIAEINHVTMNTIQTHMKSIYKKLSITSKLEAIQYYNNSFK